jgi:YHS domain-containing protein
MPCFLKEFKTECNAAQKFNQEERMSNIMKCAVFAVAVFMLLTSGAVGQTGKKSSVPDREIFTRLGNQVVCPVTGDTFSITKDSPSTEYNGKIYFFCCPMCKPKFEANPGKFLKPKSAGSMQH